MKHLLDYITIHEQNPRYGSGPGSADIDAMREATAHKIVRSAVDWGCGNSKALEQLWPDAKRTLYDPALPDHAMIPRAIHDIGLCTDVMEHIPEDEIDDTLKKQSLVAADWLYIIHKHPAHQLLPDGTNAHVTQRDERWWSRRIGKFFDHVKSWPCPNSGSRFFVRAKSFA
jgi:hypothetical protein